MSKFQHREVVLLKRVVNQENHTTTVTTSSPSVFNPFLKMILLKSVVLIVSFEIHLKQKKQKTEKVAPNRLNQAVMAPLSVVNDSPSTGRP